MKVLTDEQQQDLIALFTQLSDTPELLPDDRAQCKSWAIEMIPKRVRRKEPKVEDNT